MTKFETMDNMNVDFVALSDQELMDMEGGIIPVAVAAGIVASAAFAGLSAGVTIGISRNGRK